MKIFGEPGLTRPTLWIRASWKGVYAYEYIDSLERLEKTRIPRKRDFYITLTDIGIKEKEFEHSKSVRDNFRYTTLEEYSDLHLKIDVLLLTDVFA